MKLFGISRRGSLLVALSDGTPYLVRDRDSAIASAILNDCEVAEVTVCIDRVFTPPRKATIARTEEKQMAKAKAKKAAKKVSGKKGKC